jgi:hypothetical protein
LKKLKRKIKGRGEGAEEIVFKFLFYCSVKVFKRVVPNLTPHKPLKKKQDMGRGVFWPCVWGSHGHGKPLKNEQTMNFGSDRTINKHHNL